MPVITDRYVWWERRRLAYNIALLLGGIAGFGFFVCILVACPAAEGEEGDEITIFTLFFQMYAFLLAMSVANVFYFLGYLVDRLMPETHLPLARKAAFWSGLVFSVSLPTVPFLAVLVLCKLREG